jgi:hypothetical protein
MIYKRKNTSIILRTNTHAKINNILKHHLNPNMTLHPPLHSVVDDVAVDLYSMYVVRGAPDCDQTAHPDTAEIVCVYASASAAHPTTA